MRSLVRESDWIDRLTGLITKTRCGSPLESFDGISKLSVDLLGEVSYEGDGGSRLRDRSSLLINKHTQFTATNISSATSRGPSTNVRIRLVFKAIDRVWYTIGYILGFTWRLTAKF